MSGEDAPILTRPRRLFADELASFDVTPDGSRFLGVRLSVGRNTVLFVQNWLLEFEGPVSRAKVAAPRTKVVSVGVFDDQGLAEL